MVSYDSGTSGRSTPPDVRDCEEVTDSRGKKWCYSEPADVWNLRQEDGFVSHTSARSWQRLLAEFGPMVRQGQEPDIPPISTF